MPKTQSGRNGVPFSVSFFIIRLSPFDSSVLLFLLPSFLTERTERLRSSRLNCIYGTLERSPRHAAFEYFLGKLSTPFFLPLSFFCLFLLNLFFCFSFICFLSLRLTFPATMLLVLLPDVLESTSSAARTRLLSTAGEPLRESRMLFSRLISYFFRSALRLGVTRDRTEIFIVVSSFFFVFFSFFR